MHGTSPGRQAIATVATALWSALVLVVGVGSAAPAAALNPDRIFFDGEFGASPIGGQYITSPVVEVRPIFGTRSGVDIHLRDGTHDLTVWLITADGSDLQVGTYLNASRALGLNSGRPGLSVFGDGASCDSEGGSFEVTEISFVGDRVDSLVATWQHRCANSSAASFGGVSFNGSATFAARTIGPKLVDFGQTRVGTTGTRAVEIRNDGPGPLSVDTVSVQGTDASQFTVTADECSARVLAPAGSCRVDVTFLPTGPNPPTGQFEALLTITDDVAPSLPAGAPSGQDVVLYGAALASSPGEFVPLTPARLLDTREGNGAPVAPLTAGSAIDVQITGRGGVPDTGASAVVMNVTAVFATEPTFVTMWPTGMTRPTASQLNPRVGGVSANMVTVLLGAGGKVSAFSVAGSLELVFDVVGFYSDDLGPVGSRYVPLEPFRVFDTRDGGEPAKLGPASTLTLDVFATTGFAFRAYDPTALVLNVTATEPTEAGFVTVHPGDVTPPLASHLNFLPGQSVPNLVTVRVPPSGLVSFFNQFGRTHLIADVVGFYTKYAPALATPDSGRFIAVPPARALDTRDFAAPLGPDRYLWLTMAGYDGVPDSASAVAINVTATQPTSAGFLGVYPDDVCLFPPTSNVNFGPGETVPNSVLVRLSRDTSCENAVGAIDVYNPFGSTHVIIDVFGYFT